MITLAMSNMTYVDLLTDINNSVHTDHDRYRIAHKIMKLVIAETTGSLNELLRELRCHKNSQFNFYRRINTDFALINTREQYNIVSTHQRLHRVILKALFNFKVRNMPFKYLVENAPSIETTYKNWHQPTLAASCNVHLYQSVMNAIQLLK